MFVITEEPLLDGQTHEEEEEARDSGDESVASGSPHRKKADTVRGKAESLFSDLLYGLINAIVGIPTMISFAAIIFSVGSPFPIPILDRLCTIADLVLTSGKREGPACQSTCVC